MNRKLLVFLALAAIVFIVAYRLSGWDFDWPLFFDSLWDVHAGWLSISVVATLASYVLRAYRWQALLAPLKWIRIEPLISATIVGFAAIYMLGRAGELVRPLWLKRREGVPMPSSVATIIVERFLDAFMLIVLFAWTVLVLDLPASGGAALRLMKNAAWMLVGISAAAMVVLFVFRSNIDRILGNVPFKQLAGLLHSFAQGLSFLQRGRSLGVVAVHSAGLWILIALQFWFLMLGMNFDFSVEAATLVLVISAIGSIAQIPGIGGGFQAGYIFCMTTFFLVPAEKAIATSLVAWVFTYVPTVAGAGIYMICQGLSLKELRTAAIND